jgi:hypothetical protein
MEIITLYIMNICMLQTMVSRAATDSPPGSVATFLSTSSVGKSLDQSISNNYPPPPHLHLSPVKPWWPHLKAPGICEHAPFPIDEGV